MRPLLGMPLLVIVAGLLIGVASLTQWAMQASGFNCAVRKFGEAQGIVVRDEPAEKSSYCTGAKP